MTDKKRRDVAFVHTFFFLPWRERSGIDHVKACSYMVYVCLGSINDKFENILARRCVCSEVLQEKKTVKSRDVSGDPGREA